MARLAAVKKLLASVGASCGEAMRQVLPTPPGPALSSPFLAMPFPLNVYAHLLLLVQGETKYLHYGLFASADDDLATAQLRSNALLRERLPAPPARILEVGMGLGTFAAQLADAGYEVVAISPDQTQAKLADALAAERPNLSVLALAFEQMPGRSDAPFDVVLLRECAQYIGLADLFTGAAALLREHGRLMLIDEVALGRSADGLQNLHLLADIKAHAQQPGFNLAYEQDLSRQAAPTVDFLLEHLAGLRETLSRALRLEPTELDDLQTALQAYRAEYAAGRFGYVALNFAMP